MEKSQLHLIDRENLVKNRTINPQIAVPFAKGYKVKFHESRKHIGYGQSIATT